MDGFGVPFIDFIRDGVEGHDLLHKQGGDSGSKEADEDIVVRDAGAGGVTLEGQDLALE